MIFREAGEGDLPAVLDIHRLAFGQDEEATLVEAITKDASAEPVLSLIALEDGSPVGHVLFSRAALSACAIPVSAAILAPLAVVPAAQSQGIGGRLIEEGLARLAASGIDLVFVLGYPDYYGRHGFAAAGPQGLEAPYPIAQEHTDAWMVRDLGKDLVGTVSGKVACCEALDHPALWIE